MRKNMIEVYRLKKILLFAFLLLCIALMISNPQGAILAAKSGLSLCAGILIPSLFPFFIFSGLLINLGFAEVSGRLLRPVMKPLFNVSGSGALAFVLGIISGYPLGASCACELYQNHHCTKEEGERLLAFCNNSGPLFIIGSVGAAMYDSPFLGILLYLTHILAALTVGILFRFYHAKPNASASKSAPRYYPTSSKLRSFGEVLTDVMHRSIHTMLLICGFVVVFSVMIHSTLNFIDGSSLGGFVSGLLELTGGLYKTAATSMPLTTKLILSASILGFAGFSVHFQVMGIIAKSDLSFKPYLVGKVLQSIIAAAYMWMALKFVSLDTVVSAMLDNRIMPYYIMDFRTALGISLSYLCVSIVFIIVMCLFSMIISRMEGKGKKRMSKDWRH